MRIVIVGAGRAGLEVARHLTRIGHAVTVVDNDETVVRRASEQLGLVTLAGDATIAAVLDEADIAQSDVVVAMLRRDADNLAVALPSPSKSPCLPAARSPASPSWRWRRCRHFRRRASWRRCIRPTAASRRRVDRRWCRPGPRCCWCRASPKWRRR